MSHTLSATEGIICWTDGILHAINGCIHLCIYLIIIQIIFISFA
jgi:hypothetical protein